MHIGIHVCIKRSCPVHAKQGAFSHFLLKIVGGSGILKTHNCAFQCNDRFGIFCIHSMLTMVKDTVIPVLSGH